MFGDRPYLAVVQGRSATEKGMLGPLAEIAEKDGGPIAGHGGTSAMVVVGGVAENNGSGFA
jgi:hypothetical protein